MKALRRRLRAAPWTLSIYIAEEAFFSFFVAFLFFFFIFFVNQLLLMAEEILSKRVPPSQVALLILYSLPAIVAMASPFASLVGTLMAIGRLSSDNEILVIRSAGLPYRMVYMPVIAVGIVVSLVSFFANDVLLPAGTLEFGKLYRRLLLTTPEMELESNSVKRFNDTVLVMGSVQGRKIDELLIFDRTSAGERRVIAATDARLEEEEDTALTLDLFDAFVHTVRENVKGNYDYALAGKIRYSIRQQDLIQSIGPPGPREMSSMDVAREIRKKAAAVDEKVDEKRRQAYAAALDLEFSLRKGPSFPSWNERTSALGRLKQERSLAADVLKDRTLRVYKIEYFKKFSIPFGALSFVFLAIPLGLFTRKSGQSVGFGIGLIIAVFYWALLVGGQTLGVRLGYSPFWVMWLPNIVAVSIGTVLSIVRVFI